MKEKFQVSMLDELPARCNIIICVLYMKIQSKRTFKETKHAYKNAE